MPQTRARIPSLHIQAVSMEMTFNFAGCLHLSYENNVVVTVVMRKSVISYAFGVDYLIDVLFYTSSSFEPYNFFIGEGDDKQTNKQTTTWKQFVHLSLTSTRFTFTLHCDERGNVYFSFCPGFPLPS